MLRYAITTYVEQKPISKTNTTASHATSINSPYGFTIALHPTDKLGNGLDSESIAEFQDIGVKWIREQIAWKDIEVNQTNPPTYNWVNLDQQVALANKYGIYMDFPIQSPPQWHKSQICPADGKRFQVGVSDELQFASTLAHRYNGKNGHGYIYSFEIGNEDFDNYWDSAIGSASISCRDPKYYVPVLEAAYTTIKAASPDAMVGMFGMWYENKEFEMSFLNEMFSIDPHVSNYFDYGNLHFYNGNIPPSTGDGKQHPSFNERWQIMQSVFKIHVVTKPIWITETGWDDSDPISQYSAMQYVFDNARTSGVVKKVFWYTINWDATKDINPGDRQLPPKFSPLPAYNLYKHYVGMYPLW